MALYKTHNKFNIFLALPLLICLLYYFFHLKTLCLITFGGCFTYCTLFMSPDMDIANKIKLFSIKGLFTLPFRLYSLIFRHRGLSHSFFLGSLTRVFFLLILLLTILLLLNKNIDSFLTFIKHHKEYLIFGFIGILAADLCHILLDIRLKK